jgi:malonyl CoA-acyl carrier protein transacylase
VTKDKIDLKDIPRPGNSSVSIHAFFPGMNSRRAYTNLARDLYDNGNTEVKSIFVRAAKVLGYTSHLGEVDITPFFMNDSNFPSNIVDKWNYIGAAMTVYNLALFEHLKTSTHTLGIHSVGGESLGMIAAAIAGGALSFEDGIKVAHNTLGFIYDYVHLNNFGIWNIVSLRGESIECIFNAIQKRFPGQIDTFRWQAVNAIRDEIHVYIHSAVFDDVRGFVDEQYGDRVTLMEFKKPTNDIIHSPKLSPVRITLNDFLIDTEITFLDPKIPIVANNGSGLALTAEDARALILDMVNIPMYTAQSFDELSKLSDSILDVIVEIGYGQKTRPFIEQHNIKIKFIEYFGDQYRLAAIDKGLQALQPSNKYHAESNGYIRTHTEFELTEEKIDA